jgi:hypothetical protein
MIAPPPPPSKQPKYQPVIHYRRAFVVEGVPVHAAVTNLTAAFLDDLGADPELVGK